MADQAQLARLTELANRVWPRADGLEVGVEDGIDLSAEDDIAYVDTRDARIVFIEAPNSLDALEAALSALCEGAGPSQRMYEDAMRRCTELEERLGSITLLTMEWEAAARDAGGSELVMSLAAELRERAKGGEP